MLLLEDVGLPVDTNGVTVKKGGVTYRIYPQFSQDYEPY